MSTADVLASWTAIEDRIRQVIRRADGGQDAEDVLTAVQLGRQHVWRIVNSSGKAVGIVVTELQDYPRYRLLLIYMVAGEHARDWMTGGQQQLEAFASSNGCKYIEFHGRPGWERHARRYGYAQKMIRMRKEVGHGRGQSAVNHNQ